MNIAPPIRGTGYRRQDVLMPASFGQRRSRRGITRIEVVVIIVVVLIFLGVLIPGSGMFRETAKKKQCQENLMEIVLAAQQFHDHHNVIPYNYGVRGEHHGAATHGWSWMAQLLPYLGHDDIYKDAGIPTNTLLEAKNQIARPIPVFLCPTDPRTAVGASTDTADLGVGFTPYVEVGYTNYKGVMGSNWEVGDAAWHNRGPGNYGDPFRHGDGTFYRDDFYRKKPFSAITDGLSQTAIVGEALPDKSKWCAWPYNNSVNSTCAIDPNAKQADGRTIDRADWQNSFGFYSYHPGGLHFAFADGSVRFIDDSIERNIYRAMSTIAGGEEITLP